VCCVWTFTFRGVFIPQSQQTSGICKSGRTSTVVLVGSTGERSNTFCQHAVQSPSLPTVTQAWQWGHSVDVG